MKMRLVAACLAALALPALAQANPFSQLKGKIKEGSWEYRMQMEGMPGMPAGMTMPPITFNHCVTAKDIEQGGFTQKEGKMPEGCAIKNMKVGSDSASWRLECTKDPKMTSDVVMQMQGAGFTMKQRMTMDRGGQPMTMNSTMTARYLGPCN